VGRGEGCGMGEGGSSGDERGAGLKWGRPEKGGDGGVRGVSVGGGCEEGE